MTFQGAEWKVVLEAAVDDGVDADYCEGSKVCTKCQQALPLDGFRQDKRNSDGRSSACKACGNAYDFERRKKPDIRERKREIDRQWYKANPERYAAYARRYAQQHPELYREAQARWLETNREEHNARRRDRYYADLDEHRRAARERAAARSEATTLMVLELDDGACGICGEDVDPFEFQVDHVIPRSKGGTDHITNFQTTHPFCNRSKGDKLPWL